MGTNIPRSTRRAAAAFFFSLFSFLLTLSPPASAAGYSPEPRIGLTLRAGDTLYVRFQAQQPLSTFYPGYNLLMPTFNFEPLAQVDAFRIDLYNDAEQSYAHSMISVGGSGISGVSSIFTDPAKGADPIWTGHIDTNLTPYDDGAGLTSLTWIAGADAYVYSFYLATASAPGTEMPSVPIRSTFAINQLPPPIPEPSAIALSALLIPLLRRPLRTRGLPAYFSAHPQQPWQSPPPTATD